MRFYSDGLMVCTALMCLFMFGCSKPVAREWKRATITLHRDLKTDRSLRHNIAVEVSDPQEVERLSSFFSGLGHSRRSKRAAKWGPALSITFCENEASVTVTVDGDLIWWSEGKGDWPLRPEFKEYFMELLRKHGASNANKPSNASPPVTGAQPGN